MEKRYERKKEKEVDFVEAAVLSWKHGLRGGGRGQGEREKGRVREKEKEGREKG